MFHGERGVMVEGGKGKGERGKGKGERGKGKGERGEGSGCIVSMKCGRRVVLEWGRERRE